ncbi:MAG TPA: alpha/beta hydrolase [Ktedonobacteraceae bacterium]|nr:alpha/beta hydrolase [Ktedonobacteraceae bacterium]
MSSNTSDVAGTLERRAARSIHYTISYIVSGAEYGTDGAIILLHDIPAGAFTWEGIIPQLGGLKRAVYAVDMLGFGQSDHPWPADTSVWGQADMLSYLLRDLRLTNVILVGIGLGGGVAQILATRLYRENVASVVLINTISYLHAFAANWPLPDMEKRQDFDAPKQATYEDMMRDLRATLPNAVHNTDRFNDVIDEYVNQWDSELGKEALYQHIRLLIPSYVNSVSSDLQTVGKPMLILWGAEDQVTPVVYAERLHREIAGSHLVIVPDAGHMLLFDAPDAVANALADFISGL